MGACAAPEWMFWWRVRAGRFREMPVILLIGAGPFTIRRILHGRQVVRPTTRKLLSGTAGTAITSASRTSPVARPRGVRLRRSRSSAGFLVSLPIRPSGRTTPAIVASGGGRSPPR
jgi:hypothetical protein